MSKFSEMAGPEIWRDVRGFEGRYQVSTCGRVRSRINGKITILQPIRDRRNRAGYVRLYLGDKQKKTSVRRLVAETFLGELKPGDCILHKNCDGADDSVWNLLISDRRGLGSNSGRRNEYRCVELLDEHGNPIAVYRNCAEAARANYYSEGTVNRHCRGEVQHPRFRYERLRRQKNEL